jgi:hypothetical protein
MIILLFSFKFEKSTLKRPNTTIFWDKRSTLWANYNKKIRSTEIYIIVAVDH